MLIKVLVRPGRKESGISEPSDEFECAKCDLVTSLTSKPEGGKANKELFALLRARFGSAELVSGAASCLKVFRVPGAADEKEI